LTRLETLLDEFLDNWFHLPTLIVLALVGLALVWWLYDLNVDLGVGFIRLNTNQGNLNLYWFNGCCDLSW
jgi:hypothetical protein